MSKALIPQEKKELKAIVEGLGMRFTEIAKAHQSVDFRQECFFALQAIQDNSYLGTTALKNKASLQAAILNVAAIGLTLNPALKYAHLVPRDGKVCLDIPYGGLVKIGTDSGSVVWVQAELVREKDSFVYKGLGQMPDHQADYFKERGAIKGAYCVAKLANGDFLVTVMSIDECYAIRDRTAAYKKYKEKVIKTCPWVSDEGEMIKKTVIKRASKLWPKSERMRKAVDALNEHEGIDFEAECSESSEPSIQEINAREVKEKMEKVEQVTFLINMATDNMTLSEKGLFFKNTLKISSINDLRKKSCSELDELAKIIEVEPCQEQTSQN